MPKLELPSPPTDELKLADWLEIWALLSKDNNSSSSDLERALNTASVLRNGRIDVEEKCREAFIELEERKSSAGDAYPFFIDGSVLRLKDNPDQYAAYLFCLCLSYFRWDAKRSNEIDVNPWLLFEELSAIAAKEYINGKVINFGTSRKATKTATRSFKDTIENLCKIIGEGKGCGQENTLDAKDDKVDLVAWKDFNDGKPSKLLIFGQCAGGDNWVSKVSELNPSAFWRQWISGGNVSPLLRSFYIPHRVSNSDWNHRATYAGIMFDRCRIAYWTFKDNRLVTKNSKYRKWYKYILRVPKPPLKK